MSSEDQPSGGTPVSDSEQPQPTRSAPDQTRLARQAIQSEAAARLYAERQLAHAQREIAELTTKLSRERQTRQQLAQSVQELTARRQAAEQNLIAAERTLAEERSARQRAERARAEALATANDLQSRFEAVQRELANERQARAKSEDALAGSRQAMARQNEQRRTVHNGQALNQVSRKRAAAARGSRFHSSEPVRWWKD
jgi:chromosome segregation ATPase